MSRTAKMLFFLVLPLLWACTSVAHPGGLDARGGHYNRKAGSYHQHREISPSDSDTKVSLPKSTRHNRIRAYFSAANSDVPDGVPKKVKRDVSGSQRKRVLARDQHRCVICGSTKQLEVDHRRALMNGGDNKLGNLATLCDDCHTIKTRMDYRLNKRLRR